MGCIGHALETARDSDAISTCSDTVDAKNSGLHAAATGFVDRYRTDIIGKTCEAHRLSSRALLESRGQDTAHEYFVNGAARNTRFTHRRLDRRASQLGGADGG